MWRRPVGQFLAIVGVALFITVLENIAFWRVVFRATMWEEHRGAVLAALFVLLFCSLVIVLSLSLGARAFKFVAGTALLVSAFCGYLMSPYGNVIHAAAIRGVFETGAFEIGPLLTGDFALHMLAFGFAPCMALAAWRSERMSWKSDLALRGALIVSSVLVLAGTVAMNEAPVSEFAARYGSVRLLMNPAYPVYSLVHSIFRDGSRLARDSDAGPNAALSVSTQPQTSTIMRPAESNYATASMSTQ